MFLSNREEANEIAAKIEGDEPLPTHIPVTRDMLLRTHGVPYITERSENEVVIRQLLESPGMFMNHSRNPVSDGGGAGVVVLAAVCCCSGLGMWVQKNPI